MTKYRVSVVLGSYLESESKGHAFGEALKKATRVDLGDSGLEVTGVDVWKIKVDKDGNEERSFDDD